MGTYVAVNGFLLRAAWAHRGRSNVMASVELVSLADGTVAAAASAVDLGGVDRRTYGLELVIGRIVKARVPAADAEAAVAVLRSGLAERSLTVDASTALEAARRAAVELGLPEPVPPAGVLPSPSLPPPSAEEQRRQLRELIWRLRWPWRPPRPTPKGGATRVRIRQWSAWRKSLSQDVPRFPSGRRVKDHYMRRVGLLQDYAGWTTWVDIDTRLLHELLVNAGGEIRAGLVEPRLKRQETPIPKRCLDRAKASLGVVTVWRGRTAWWRLPGVAADRMSNRGCQYASGAAAASLPASGTPASLCESSGLPPGGNVPP